jgi:hypothetical protein
MPNDFEPVVGYRFTFKTKPMGDWDGIVHCEVLQCDPPALALFLEGRLGFQSGPRGTAQFRGELDAEKVDDGTHLKMVHDGFVFPGNEIAFEAMSPGWGRVMDSITRVAADGEAAPSNRMPAA